MLVRNDLAELDRQNQIANAWHYILPWIHRYSIGLGSNDERDQGEINDVEEHSDPKECSNDNDAGSCAEAEAAAVFVIHLRKWNFLL